MSMIIRVVVNIPGIDTLYDYDVPDQFTGIQQGSLVVVPFGKMRAQAVVVELNCPSSTIERKEILGILDVEPVLNNAQIALAAWMADHFYAGISDCVHIMLPPGINQMADMVYSPNEQLAATVSLPPMQKKIMELITTRGAMRSRQLQAAFPHVNWKTSVRGLLKKGYLKSSPYLSDPRVQRKTIRTAQIAVSKDEYEARKQNIGRAGTKAVERRAAVMEFLLQEGIPVNTSWVYAASGANSADLKTLEEKGFILLGEAEIWRDPLKDIEVSPTKKPTLTTAQIDAWGQIGQQLSIRGKKRPILVHGVTGSGKTELYLRAVERVVERGRQVLVLVPEISLTPQTVKRFMARFPGQVGLVHSRLSAGERVDTWRRARMGKLPIIIGPRSALFTPLPDLGLIVIDEFHDASFYQTENRPLYDTVQCALQYAEITESNIILGSATPQVELYFRAQSEGWTLIHMPDRILAHQEYIQQKCSQFPDAVIEEREKNGSAAILPLPLVQVVDMRNELRQGNHPIFSRSLQIALRKVLDKKQQAILFLNRRGGATYIFCRNCGKVLLCPRCDIPLTMHADKQKLICHICGYERDIPQLCPECGDGQIRKYGGGTQKVEEQLSLLFPSARILRWDADTTRQRGAEQLLLSHFANHHADFLIGTQMLAKGLDLPLVTLVGIVLADVGLNFPDFKAAERNFQVLTQVAGRSGRSPLGGQVILQTYQPDHYAIQRASRHDFNAFYADEIVNRRNLHYPPFTKLIRLELRHQDQKTVIKKASALIEQINTIVGNNNAFSDIIISGPVPPFFSRQRGYFRQHIILRGRNPAEILTRLDLQDWKIEVDPPDLL